MSPLAMIPGPAGRGYAPPRGPAPFAAGRRLGARQAPGRRSGGLPCGSCPPELDIAIPAARIIMNSEVTGSC